MDGNGHLTRFSTEPPAAPPPRPAARWSRSARSPTSTTRTGRAGYALTLPAYGDLDAGWLAVLCPGAGRGKGIVALPDPDDTVLVVLPGGEPAEGIVLGSLFGAVEPYDAGIDDGAVRGAGRCAPPAGSRSSSTTAAQSEAGQRGRQLVELAPTRPRLHAAYRPGDLRARPGHGGPRPQRRLPARRVDRGPDRPRRCWPVRSPAPTTEGGADALDPHVTRVHQLRPRRQGRQPPLAALGRRRPGTRCSSTTTRRAATSPAAPTSAPP